MLAPAFAHGLLALIVALSILLMLIRPGDTAEVVWIGAGVFLLLCFRLVTFKLIGTAVRKGMDVYLFLIGMMLLSELARENGVFDWLAATAVRRANRSRKRLFLLVYAAGMIVTVFMSNDATAVVLTPAILVTIRKADIKPLSYLFVCAFIANAASFVLPISNPANLVVFHNQMPALGRWLAMFGVPSIFSIAVTFFVLGWIFRDELSGPVGDVSAHPLDTHGWLVLGGLAATTGVLLTASGLNWDLGLPTCLTALAVTTIVAVKVRRSPLPLFREISWSTLALVAGLFIMVDALDSVGALRHTQDWLASAESLGRASGALAIGFVVAVANNLVNNLPLGLIAGSTIQQTHASRLIASTVMIGVDLGPNLSITGSLATILWLIALRKEKLNVSFWSFLKVGAIAMPIALLFSLGSAIAMQWLTGR